MGRARVGLAVASPVVLQHRVILGNAFVPDALGRKARGRLRRRQDRRKNEERGRLHSNPILHKGGFAAVDKVVNVTVCTGRALTELTAGGESEIRPPTKSQVASRSPKWCQCRHFCQSASTRVRAVEKKVIA